jgi:hypothetical protein
MPLVFCPECGRQVSYLATSCPQCNHPITRATIAVETGGDSEILSLRKKAEGAAFLAKKRGQSYKIASGFCEKSAAGAFLVGLFQSNQNSLTAYGLTLALLIFSLCLNFLASD